MGTNLISASSFSSPARHPYGFAVPDLEKRLTRFEAPADRKQMALKLRFAASKTAFLKLDRGLLLLVGQSNSPSDEVEFLATDHSFALELPVGFQALFLDGPACAITNCFQVLDLPGLSRFVGRPGNYGLVRAIKADIHKRYACLPGFSLIDELMRAVLRAPEHGVAGLAEMAGYSVRQLQRIFLRYAGFAPKEFLEILRFERAAAGQGGLPEGYYDQSHYIKAYRRFAGGTPGRKAAGLSDFSYTGHASPFIVSSI
jgi:AraC-like DNA-binding protein